MITLNAITVIQPWATLIALQAKLYETRTWKIPYRGLIAIHAGQNKEEIRAINDDLIDMRSWDDARKQKFLRAVPRGIYLHHLREVLPPQYRRPNDLPLGAILCIADLVAIHRVEKIRDALDQRERVFGGYSDGRYAWEMRVVQVFEKPIPQSGARGIWRWTVPGDTELKRSA